MLKPSKTISIPPNTQEQPLTLPSRGSALPEFTAYRLNHRDPLRQVQEIVGCRPILLVGEGTHRTNNLFAFQSAMAHLAIERGCRHLFLEVPQLRVTELSEIMKAGGGPKAVEGFIRDNFYPTWSDRTIVQLLVDIDAFNREHPDNPVYVHGIDPQVTRVERSLAKLSQTLPAGAKKDDVLRLRAAWEELGEQKNSFSKSYDDGVSEHEIERRRTSASSVEKTCLGLIDSLLTRMDLSGTETRLLSAIKNHIEVMTVKEKDKTSPDPMINRRDETLAKNIIDPLRPLVRNWQEQAHEAPLAVVLAHNTHVSFGPPGEQDYFSQGMGFLLRRQLREAGLGDNCCTTICQTSASGSLALLPRELQPFSPSSVTHSNTMDPLAQEALQVAKKRTVLIHFPPANSNTNPDPNFCVHSFGAKNLRKDKSSYPHMIRPEQQAEFFVAYDETWAANWIANNLWPQGS